MYLCCVLEAIKLMNRCGMSAKPKLVELPQSVTIYLSGTTTQAIYIAIDRYICRSRPIKSSHLDCSRGISIGSTDCKSNNYGSSHSENHFGNNK